LKIKSVDTFKISLPVKPENLSFGKVDRVDYVIVRIEAGKFTGYGEAATLQGPTWSEESMETISEITKKYLAKTIIGKETSEYRKIVHLMDEKVQGNNFAKAAVEMAMLDALGKEMDMPVWSIIGGKYRDSIPLSWTIANNDPELDAKESLKMAKKGWRIFKIKVGSLPIKEELERIIAVREAVGEEASIRIDVNQGWTLNEAFRASPLLEKVSVDLLEQPLPKWDTAGAKLLAARSEIPIVADESLCSIQDAIELIQRRAAGVFAYKLTKMGGISNAQTINSIANTYRIDSYVGCMIETSIGTAAYLNFAASMPELEYGCELFGPLRIKEDVVSKSIEYHEGNVLIPKEPGLGINVNEEKVETLSERNQRGSSTNF
jgi:muconate cycloisomerase